MVIVTQNPIEYEGTFSLPEAQLDRFLLKINIGYPYQSFEIKMLESQQIHHPIDHLLPVTNGKELTKVQKSAIKYLCQKRLKNTYFV